MSYNIGPKIGIDGEKEFRDSIRALNTEYKTLEAQTKALTAEFEANGDEIGKLTRHSEQLEKQIDVQKRKMDQLEDAVAKATEKYGDNSIEANRLKGALYDTQSTLAGLESELKDTKNQLEHAADGMEEFEQETEDAGNAALDFADILNANLVSDLAMEALEEIGEAVVDFAAGSLDAAADVNAAGSQFEQTFGDMEATAKRTLEGISDETDIAVTRMQGDFTKMYAFTKTAGADSEQAMDIAGRAMVAAADNAAYYDQSIEEVTETLQSFLKGNYENDAALGISATETTRNAKANEMYATSFDKLSESQKVDVLLAMVEAGNAASGALGQAAREADSWANVQGELDEALLQMQATLGQPVLEAAIPIIKDITDAIYELIEKSDWEKLDRSTSDFVDTMKDAEEQFSATSKEAESSAYMAKRYVQRLEELETAGLDTAETQREYANVVGHLKELYPELNLQINENTGLVNQSKEAILGEIEAMKQKALYMAMEERYTTALKAQAEATLAVRDAEYARTGIQEQRMALEEHLTETTGMSVNQLIRLYNSQLSVNYSMQDSAAAAAGATLAYMLMGDAVGSLTPAQMELISQLIQLQTEESNLNREIAEGEDVISSYDDELINLEKTLGEFSTGTDGAAQSQGEMADKTQEVQAQLDALQTEYDETVVSSRGSIESQIGLFDQLATESEMSAQEIIDNWNNQRAAFDEYTANMEKAVDMGLDQTLVQQLSDGSEESMLILNELVNNTDTNIDAINEAFQRLSEAKDTTAEAIAEIRTGANAEMEKLIANSKTWGSDIVDGAAGSVNANAYKFKNAMGSLASAGNNAFRNNLLIHSPSRIMIGNSEDTVDGAVVGVDRNIEKFEAAMENLAEAGDMAFLNERLTAAELYPSVMEIPISQTSAPAQRPVNYGGFEFHIYQTEGEDAEALAYRVMDIIQTEIIKAEGVL